MSLTDILHVNALFPRIGTLVICFAFKRQRNVPSLITKPKMIHLEQIKVKSTQMDSISKIKTKPFREHIFILHSLSAVNPVEVRYSRVRQISPVYTNCYHYNRLHIRITSLYEIPPQKNSNGEALMIINETYYITVQNKCPNPLSTYITQWEDPNCSNMANKIELSHFGLQLLDCL